MPIDVMCAVDARNVLGEGPIWCPTEQALYWIDVARPSVHRYHPETGEAQAWPLPKPVGSIAIRKGGGFLLAFRAGLAWLDQPGGPISGIDVAGLHLDRGRFNDGKCDREGRFWVGTLDRHLTEPVGELYRIGADLTCLVMDRGFTISNGLGWSPDDRTMYFTDSPARRIYAYDFDLASGVITNRRVFASFDGQPGRPDGCTVDADGYLWTAVIDGWRIVRLALPAIFASGLLIFILAAEMYTIPGIIGSTAGFSTLPWKIYQDSTAAPVHQAHAAASGTMLLWITLLGVWLQRRITRVSERFVTVTGKGFRGRPIPLGRARWLAFAFIGFYILSADVLPFGALLLSSVMKYSAPRLTAEIFTLRHYEEFFTLRNMRDALWNTTYLALLSGAACVLIGFVISYMEVRQSSRRTRLLAFVSVLPVAVPGLVYGIGLLWTFLQTPFYGTVWTLLLAYVAKFLPYGVLVSRAGVLQIHGELEQSARMSGAGPLRVLGAITVPLMKATLIAIFFFVMLMSIKELSASVLLYTERSQVLSVLTWHYMDAGNYQFAAAIGMIQTVIMIGLVVVTRAIFRVNLERAIGKDVV